MRATAIGQLPRFTGRDGDQVVLLGRNNLAWDHLARVELQILLLTHKDQTIDVGGSPHKSAQSKRPVGRAVRDRSARCSGSHQLPISLGHDLLLDLHQLRSPLFLHFLGEMVGSCAEGVVAS